MSDIMTVIDLQGESGMMNRGRRTRAEMISYVKKHAAEEVAKWQKFIDAADDEFKVRVVRGVYVQKLIKEL
jgi:hypothetical protein